MNSGGSVHRRVQRRDEPFGHVQLVERGPLVRRQAPPRARLQATCAPAHRPAAGCPAASAESRSTAADRSRPPPTAAAPSPARDARAAERQPRRVDERQHGARVAELIATDGSVASRRSQAGSPSAAPIAAARRIGQRGAGARDAVVEAQHPDPAARKHMVHRRIVDRIGRRLAQRAAGDPSARRLRSACRAPASAAASDAVASRSRSARCRNPRGPLASMTNRAVIRTDRAVTLALEDRRVRPRGEWTRAASRPDRWRLRAEPPARARDRSPAGTSACRRSRRAGWRRPATAARVRRRRRTRAGLVEEEREAALQAARRHPVARAATCPHFENTRTRGRS